MKSREEIVASLEGFSQTTSIQDRVAILAEAMLLALAEMKTEPVQHCPNCGAELDILRSIPGVDPGVNYSDE